MVIGETAPSVSELRRSGDKYYVSCLSLRNEYGQLLLECAVARYQSVHASPDKADKQKITDVYGTDRAKARNDHGPEPIQPILNYMNQKVLSSLRDPGSDNGRMRETMRFRMV